MRPGTASKVSEVRALFRNCARTQIKGKVIPITKGIAGEMHPAGIFDHLFQDKGCMSRFIQCTSPYGPEFLVFRFYLAAKPSFSMAGLTAGIYKAESGGVVFKPISNIDEHRAQLLDRLEFLKPSVGGIHQTQMPIAFGLKEIFERESILSYTYGLFLTLSYLDKGFAQMVANYNMLFPKDGAAAEEPEFLKFLPAYFGGWVERFGELRVTQRKLDVMLAGKILEEMEMDVLRAMESDNLPEYPGDLIQKGLKEELALIKSMN
jgi:hypothetical protein